MVLLRRGRSAHIARTGFEVDVVFDLTRGTVRRVGGCCLPWRPPTEVFESGNSLIVRAEIGGLTGGELEVLADREHLTIRGERAIVQNGEIRLYHESRIEYGPFDVTLRLPFPVDVRAAAATYEDGMVTIRLPRQAATHIAPSDESHVAAVKQGDR